MTAYETVDALRKNRTVLEAYIDLGRMFLERGQPEYALDPLERVLEASPLDHEALAAKAMTLSKLQRHAEAASLFAEVLKHDAKAEYFIERGRCLAAMGLLPEALACIDVGRVTLGDNLELELERNLFLLQFHGDSVMLFESRGDIYAESRNPDEAYLAYEHALHELNIQRRNSQDPLLEKAIVRIMKKMDFS